MPRYTATCERSCRPFSSRRSRVDHCPRGLCWPTLLFGVSSQRCDDCWIRRTTAKTSRVAQKPHHTAIYKGAVENESKQGDQAIPPFCFPAPHVSGPDIVFFVRINGNIYPCFVQLKLRQVLEDSGVEKALATVSSRAMQEKMDKELEKMQKDQKKQQEQQQQDSTASIQSDQRQPPRLQDYCPTGTYIRMVITYPAEVVKFQVVRPDPEPELEGLQRVSIDIDDNNFPKIFSRRHVEFLYNLKGYKRRSEEQQSQTSKKKKADDPHNAASKNRLVDI